MNVKHMGVMLLALVGGYSLTAATTVTPGDGKLTIDVPTGEDYTLTDSDVSALAGLDLYKTGTGRLIISKSLKDAGWDGEIVVEDGYLRTTRNEALGGVVKGTVIKPGATLEIEDNSTGYGAIHAREPFTIGGSGVGGFGAVYAVRKGSSISTNGMFAESDVTLTADTTVGYSGTEGFYGSCGFRTTGSRASTLYMNGYTLTFTRGDSHGLFGTTVKGAGIIKVERSCSLTVENNTFFENKAGNKLLLGENAKLVFQNLSGADWAKDYTKWQLETEGDATLTIGSNGPSSWSGPVYLGGTLTVNGSSSQIMRFRGDISGPGKYVHKTGKVNFTGTISLPAAAHGGLAGVKGMFSVSAINSEIMDDDYLYGIWHGATTNMTQPVSAKSSTSVYDQKQSDFEFWLGLGCDYEFTKEIDKAVTVYHGGADETLTIASQTTASPSVINYAGTLKFAGAEMQNASWIDLRGGTVEVAAGTELNLSSNAYVCAPFPDVARLRIGGVYGHEATVCGTRLGRNLAIGATCGRGIMEILDGAVVEETFPVSYESDPTGSKSHVPNGWGKDENFAYGLEKTTGSYYQRGGIFRTPLGVENNIGNYFSCYYSLEGGLLHLRHSTHLAKSDKATVVLHQRDGACIVENGDFNSAGPGRRVYHYISGGTFVSTNGAYVVGRQDWEDKAAARGYNALAVLTVHGANSLCDVNIDNPDWLSWKSSIRLASQHYSRGQVNLLSGGVLRSNGMQKEAGLNGNVADVAIDGGVMDMAYQLTSVSGKNIFRNFTGENDHVRVFGCGAVIDTNGKDWSLGVPLESPEGNGVESIALPDGIVNAKPWEFTASPTVEITDPTGVGTGATAIAVFDTVEGKVTGIKITNRGNNYTAANALISRGGHTNSWTAAATVTANVSGGLEKRGSGTLVIDKVCTYTGLTRVSGGTLKLGVDGAIDASSGIVLDGGTLDVDSKAFNVPLAGGAGSVVGKSEIAMSADMVFDAGLLVSGKSIAVEGKAVFPAGAKVTIVNPEELYDAKKNRFALVSASEGFVGALPALDEKLTKEEWRLRLSHDGKQLYVYRYNGFRLICR